MKSILLALVVTLTSANAFSTQSLGCDDQTASGADAIRDQIKLRSDANLVIGDEWTNAPASRIADQLNFISNCLARISQLSGYRRNMITEIHLYKSKTNDSVQVSTNFKEEESREEDKYRIIIRHSIDYPSNNVTPEACYQQFRNETRL